MKTFFSIIIWIYWALCITIFFIVVSLLYIFTVPFDRYNKIPNRALKGLAWVMLKLNPGWTFEIKGADISKISHPTIVVANHQSFMDMPLTYLLPWSMKWVAKKSLFGIPILGWIIYMTGHLGIDRKSMRSVKKLDKLVEPIKEGIPAMIFPEGTRTQTGDLKAFKNGAFKMAKQYNFNILPIVLHGGYQAMPPGDWRIHYRQHFVLSVLEPIPATEYRFESELKDTVFRLIERELKSLQNSTKRIKEINH